MQFGNSKSAFSLAGFLLIASLALAECKNATLEAPKWTIVFNCAKKPHEYDCRDLDLVNLNVLNLTTLDLVSVFKPLSDEERNDVWKINFAFNEIKEFRNTQIEGGARLNHLIDLNLNNNHISRFGRRPFASFVFLRKLDLNRNKITEIEEHLFFNLSQLLHLDLSDNQISKFDLNAFKNLKSLKTLDLSGNSLLFQNEFFNLTRELLPRLEVLVLKNCGLLNLNAIHFSSSLVINSLNIGNNLFSKIPNDQLANLKRLRALDISGNNQVYGLNRDDFKSLSRVEILRMSNMAKMKRIKEYAFSGLVRLKELVCSYNPLLKEINEKAFLLVPDSEFYKSVASMKNLLQPDGERIYLPLLDTVELNNNLLSKLSNNFFDVRRLVKLDVSNNPLRCNSNLNFLFELSNTSILLNQQQTSCSLPTRLAGQSFASLRTSGVERFEKEPFIDDEHQAFFGLLCVMMISFLVVCSICILRALRVKEKAQKASNRYYQLTGFRVGLLNCFNCFGLIKTKGFYNNFNVQAARGEMVWDEDQELESQS